MNRTYFLKALLGLPFSGFFVRLLQRGGRREKYLLNKFYVAGFQYYSGPTLIEDISAGEKLRLTARPNNGYDNFAVAIYRGTTMLGHVPRSDNKHISRLLQQNVSLYCKVAESNPTKDTWKMLKVHIYFEY